MNYVLIFLSVIIISIGGLCLFSRGNIKDRPGPDIIPARKPVPTMQGLSAYLIFVIVSSIFFPHRWGLDLFLGFFVGISIIIIITFVDEYFFLSGKKGLNPIIRLLGQVLAAVLALYIGNIYIDEWIWQGNIIIMPMWIFYIFFIIRSMLCINAINRFDGINGQASGVSSIGFLTIALLIKWVVLPYYTIITPENLYVLEWVLDVSVVFLFISIVYSFIEYKPYGLLRDMGTMMFGFALAYLSIVGGAKIGTLVVALSLVIFDAIRVGLHRIFVMKKNPLKGDYVHLHYRLLGLGWSRGETRFFVRGWSLFMMILMLLQGAERFPKLIIFLMMSLVFFGVNAYIFRYKKIPCGKKY